MDNSNNNAKGEGILSRMALNDNKAGMEGLDTDKINSIIMEASKGSRFYENEQKKERQVNQRIEKMMQQKALITEDQLKKAQVQVETMVSELESQRDLSRVIVHTDMDAFYAAVEMRDCPDLGEKPMAVGSMSMLSTSNYHARKYGVRAAMPGFIAKKLCPNLVIVPTNFDKYRAVSKEIQTIFAEYDPNFQTMSLDEAYLDFTEHLKQRKSWPESARTHYFSASSNDNGEAQMDPMVTSDNNLSPVLFEDSPTSSPVLSSSGSGATFGKQFEVFGTSVEEAVREMRFRIEQKTKLTASAGIAPNRMLAKVCSDKNKPNGQYRLPSTREAVMDFIQNLPVRKVPGIGKVSEKMLSALGISSCSHFGQQMALLSLLFSETAWHHFIELSLGLGSTFLSRHEERKSMSTERTFKELSKAEDQFSLCKELCEDLAEDLKKECLKGKTVTLKLKNVNFEVKTRAMTLPYAVATADEIFAVAKDLLKTEIENELPCALRLRLMGVRVSAFVSTDDKKPQQKSIIGFFQQSSKDCSAGSSEAMSQKSEKPQILWHSRQTWRDEPKQSFFQKAHAKRLQAQLQEYGTTEQSTLSDINIFNNKDLSTQMQDTKSYSLLSIKHKYISPSPEPQASTSGCNPTQSESLTCPVCFSQVKTTDLNDFNSHIDQCLNGASTRPNEISDSESDLNSENRDIKVGDVEVDKNKLTIIEYSQQDFTQVNQLASHNRDVVLSNSDRVTTVDSQQLKPWHEKCPALVCPVCHKTQDTNDLTAFNHHVDLCLNQEVLQKLGGHTLISMKPTTIAVTNKEAIGNDQQATKGKTKRRDPPASPPSKKAKGLGPHNTIDKFFR